MHKKPSNSVHLETITSSHKIIVAITKFNAPQIATTIAHCQQQEMQEIAQKRAQKNPTSSKYYVKEKENQLS